MLDAFFVAIKPFLPKRRTTIALLSVGVIGIIGVLVSVLLGFQMKKRAEKVSEFQIDLGESSTNKDQEKVAFGDDNTEASTVPSLLPMVTSASVIPSTKISVNTATRDQLIALPYIGDKKADQVVQSRPYHSMDEFFLKNKFSASQKEKLSQLIEI